MRSVWVKEDGTFDPLPISGFRPEGTGVTKRSGSAGRHAKRQVQAELRRRHWSEAELARRRKGDPEKVKMAWRLRQESTMTVKWIAQRLKMGTWTYVSNCLVQKRKDLEKCQ